MPVLPTLQKNRPLFCSRKFAILAHLVALNFGFYEFLNFLKAEKQINTSKVSKMIIW